MWWRVGSSGETPVACWRAGGRSTGPGWEASVGSTRVEAIGACRVVTTKIATTGRRRGRRRRRSWRRRRRRG